MRVGVMPSLQIFAIKQSLPWGVFRGNSLVIEEKKEEAG
jgi:hypothetical protein